MFISVNYSPDDGFCDLDSVEGRDNVTDNLASNLLYFLFLKSSLLSSYLLGVQSRKTVEFTLKVRGGLYTAHTHRSHQRQVIPLDGHVLSLFCELP